MTRWFKHVDCPDARIQRSSSRTGYWNGLPRCPYCGSVLITETTEPTYEPITYDPSDGSAKGVRG